MSDNSQQNPAAGNQNASSKADAQPQKNEEFDPSKIQDHVKKLAHKLPTGHQPYKVVVRPFSGNWEKLNISGFPGCLNAFCKSFSF